MEGGGDGWRWGFWVLGLLVRRCGFMVGFWLVDYGGLIDGTEVKFAIAVGRCLLIKKIARSLAVHMHVPLLFSRQSHAYFSIHTHTILAPPSLHHLNLPRHHPLTL